MARRNPNGYGSVIKLKGNRRRPYMACVSQIVAEGSVIPPKEKRRLQSKIEALHDIPDTRDVAVAAAEIKYELDILLANDTGEYRDNCIAQLESYFREKDFKGKQKKSIIGYYSTLKEANIALAEYNRSPYDLDARTATFGEVYKMAYKDARICKKAEATQVTYKQGFDKCKAIHDTPMSEIKLSHLTEVMDGVNGKSASLQNRVITVLKMVFAYAMKNEIVQKDYSEYVKIGDVSESRPKSAYTRDEVAMLWDNIDWEYKSSGCVKSVINGEKVAEILLILCYTGMRIEELLSLKTEQIYPEAGYIDLMGTKTSAAKRLIPIHPKIAPIIKRRYNPSNTYLIVDTKGDKVKYSSFKDVAFKSFKNKFNFNHTIHEARHTFATYSKSSKMDTTMRAFIMGHANKNITDDIYTHPEVLLPELKTEIRKFKIINPD